MFHHGENQFPWICVEIKNSENLWVKTRMKHKIRLKEIGYREFLQSTLKICKDAIIVSNVDNADVQRSPLNGNFFI